MTEKKPTKKVSHESPIKKHKEEDITELRKVLLEIIRNDTATKKDRIEASKLLARMHHSLQADKVTAKAEVNQAQLIAANTLTKAEEEKLEALLNAS